MTSNYNAPSSFDTVNIAAFSIYEPTKPLIPFIPSWYNVWESHMFNKANKKTGHDSWCFKRYGINYDIYLREGLRKTSYRPYIHAMEQAFDDAYSQLNHKQQNILKKERNGLIYVDSWGELSVFEKIDSWRDAYTLNIIPKSIIKKFGIKDFSCKVRGERNGLMSALLLAQNLLNSNQLDNVFIYGGFRAIPILVFTEIERQPKVRKTGNPLINNSISVERTSCLILNKKNDSNTSIYVNRYFSLSEDKRESINILLKNWNDCIGENTHSIYSAFLPTYEYIDIQNKSFNKLIPDVDYYTLNTMYGDSGFLTPALMLNHLDFIKNQSSHNIMTTIDGERGVWLLDCWRR